MTFIEERAEEVSELARILIGHARPGYAPPSVAQNVLDRESAVVNAIGFDAAGAPNSELLRIDYHLLDETPGRLYFGNLLRRNLLPFIKGVGEIGFVGGKLFEGLIVRAAKPSADSGTPHYDLLKGMCLPPSVRSIPLSRPS
jgi:hypothetical protein